MTHPGDERGGDVGQRRAVRLDARPRRAVLTLRDCPRPCLGGVTTTC